jgi:hypothetical protein
MGSPMLDAECAEYAAAAPKNGRAKRGPLSKDLDTKRARKKPRGVCFAPGE